MWNFKVIAVLLVAALIQKAAGATINVMWTTNGTAEYTVNSPLLVKMGDYVLFSCNTPMSSSIWILEDKLQYDSCNCSAIPEGCNDNQLVVAPCTIGIPNYVFINKIDSPLPSVFDYFPGETYYLVDFAYLPRMTSGGNCQTGPIKLVMKVEDVDTTQTTSLEPVSSSATSEATDSTEMNVTTPTKQTTLAPTSTVAIPPVIIIPSIIVVTFGIVALFIAVVLLVIIRRRCEKNVHYPVEKKTVAVEELHNERARDVAGAVITAINTEESSNHNNPSNVKEDLTLSQSFHQYEPMTEYLRTSQSSLLMHITDVTSQYEDTDQVTDYVVSEKSEADCTAIMKEHQDDDVKACPMVEDTMKDTENQPPKEKLDPVEGNLKRCTEDAPQLTNLNICSFDPEEESDLINLETPIPVFSPESSITSFTTLAESRTRKLHQAMEMESLTENPTETESNDETTQESDTTCEKPKDNNTTQSHDAQEAPLKMVSKPQILPRKSKLPISTSAMENLNRLVDHSSEVQRPGTPNPYKKPTPKPRLLRKSETEHMSSQCVLLEVSH